jgi:hypothetical protein
MKSKMSMILLILGSLCIIAGAGYPMGFFSKEIMFILFFAGLIMFSIRSFLTKKDIN